jgi:hypothetical protein
MDGNFFISIVEAATPLLFGMIVFVGILIFKNDIHKLLKRPFGLSFELFGNKFEINPSRGGDIKDGHSKIDSVSPAGGELAEISVYDPIPTDYIFLTHISFYRYEKQQIYESRTKIYNIKHYDIRVVVDSYYKGAIERIIAVKYILHKAYPEPNQIRVDPKDHFMLKEVANGDYVLQALVWLKGVEKPLYLKRHITLYKTEEKIWKKWLGKMGSKAHS